MIFGNPRHPSFDGCLPTKGGLTSEKFHSGLSDQVNALKRRNVNNPRRNRGFSDNKISSALKELNMKNAEILSPFRA
jgi:hypothetical protein